MVKIDGAAKDARPLARSALALLLAAGLTPASRGDTVRFQNGLTVTGEILQYDERGVTVRLANGREIHKPLADVKKVDAQFHPDHEAGDRALEKREFVPTVAHLQAALQAESREWARLRIRSALVRAYQGAVQLDLAGETFLELVASRKDVEVFAVAPLIWREEETVPREALALAGRWLGDGERPAARLLAASWLLASDKDKALPVLGRLQTDAAPRIHLLARAQLWRTKLDQPKEDELKRFEELIGRMPTAIRGGPQYLFARARERLGPPAEAALAYLRVAWLYAPSSELAADSLRRASAASRGAGFPADARKILDELQQEYPESKAANMNPKRVPGSLPAPTLAPPRNP